MIPTFDHCPDCGNRPVPVPPAWYFEVWPLGVAIPAFWCSFCKIILR